MLISSASPSDLIDWFHNCQHKQRVLCLLLAPSNSDQTEITTIVKDVFAVDATLGGEIAVLLFHSRKGRKLGIETGSGSCKTFGGQEFPAVNSSDETTYPLRNLAMFRDMRNEAIPHRERLAQESARKTARFVHELMGLCTVTPEEIPAACLLVQGLERSIVIPLGENWTADTL